MISKKSKKTKSIKMMKSKCKNYLNEKIRKNMKELKRGKYKSREQAIAVSYSQLKKKFPSCRKYMKIR